MAAEQQNVAGHVGLSPKFTPKNLKVHSLSMIGVLKTPRRNLDDVQSKS
jgi:hypothetical protein